MANVLVSAYYNEIDPFAAQWLRNLIAAGHIAPGDVDERSIKDVSPDDLKPYTQCHFFAGIGVWSYALRLAGWPDDRPVWTGSCPCQPFSVAGAGRGVNDERHLWPDWFRLIRERRPAVVFGEQVASKDGLGWLDAVHIDLEAAGYAVGAADLCAAGVGAPHIRQRLWFVGERMADADDRSKHALLRPQSHDSTQDLRRSAVDRLGGQMAGRNESELGGLADASNDGSQGRVRGGAYEERQALNGPAGCDGADFRPSPTNGYWRDADWLFCRDGKWRPVEPGTFPLAHGATARMGRLRAYGNAIVPQVAQAFIEAYLDAAP